MPAYPDPVDTGAADKLLSGLGKVEQDAKSLSEKLLKMTLHTRRMDSVPPSVDLEPADKIASMLLELEKKAHTLSDVCGKMRELLHKLDNVPLAVDEADIKVRTEVWTALLMRRQGVTAWSVTLNVWSDWDVR